MYTHLTYVIHIHYIRFGHIHSHIIDDYVHFIFLNSYWTLIFYFCTENFLNFKKFWFFFNLYFWYRFWRFWNMYADVHQNFFFEKSHENASGYLEMTLIIIIVPTLGHESQTDSGGGLVVTSRLQPTKTPSTSNGNW